MTKKEEAELRRRIARNLKTLRESITPPVDRGVIARKFDPPLTRAAIAQWENGVTLPDFVKAIQLAKIYERSIDALVYGDELQTRAEVAAINGVSAEGFEVARQWDQLDRKSKALIAAMIRHNSGLAPVLEELGNPRRTVRAILTER